MQSNTLCTVLFGEVKRVTRINFCNEDVVKVIMTSCKLKKCKSSSVSIEKKKVKLLLSNSYCGF